MFSPPQPDSDYSCYPRPPTVLHLPPSLPLLELSVFYIFYSPAMGRNRPNIIITGTPGVGKTSHCELLAQVTGLDHLSINKIVMERACHDGWDSELKSWIVEEDKVSLVTERPGRTTSITANLNSFSTPSKTK